MFAYLDHAASSPMRASAIEAMRPFLDEQYANPSGAHRFARRSRRAIDEARDRVAESIGCRPSEVVFTGGGTESDNAVVLGAVRRHGGRAVCPAAEHHAVLHCVEHVGGAVVAVTADGAVDEAALVAELDGGAPVSVVSVMAVNNEVGTITDMESVSRAVRRHAPGAILHTDAVQAACWLDLRTLWPHVDAMSLSAHKFGGPKGVGVTVLRDGVSLEPLILGGGQEADRRSGTHNVAGIVATAEALAETDAHRASELVRVGELGRRFAARVTGSLDGVQATVPESRRVPGVVHLCVEGAESEALLFVLDAGGVCASAASACASGAMEPSHVLAAMCVARERSRGALRFSLGHTTTPAEVDHAADVLVDGVRTLRERAA